MPKGVYQRKTRSRRTMKGRKTQPHTKKVFHGIEEKEVPTQAIAKGVVLPEPGKDKTKLYDDAANRIAAAVSDLNKALKEGRAVEELRCELFIDREELPAKLRYRIYRLTHAAYTWQVDIDLKDQDGVTDWWKGKYRPVPKPDQDEGV